jgi:hypothetical protein
MANVEVFHEKDNSRFIFASFVRGDYFTNVHHHEY